MAIGDTVLRQTAGVSVGGFPSPAMAMMVCIRAERALHASLGTDAKFFGVSRYIDDCSILQGAG